MGILQSRAAYAIMPIGKSDSKSIWTKNEPPNRSGVRFGGSSFLFYGGKAPTRLFVVLIVPVKPFANEVANHACRDSN